MSRSPIGLFYGSSTCYTEMAAEKIAAQLGAGAVDLFNVVDEPLSTCRNYEHLIFGIPTWDYGELQEDWEDVWDEIGELDLRGKKAAIYGLGDQIGYPEWFQDAMGYLYHQLLACGADVVGQWPNSGYEFDKSQALTADGQHFVGLALDDENQFEASDERIASWCRQLRREFGL